MQKQVRVSRLGAATLITNSNYNNHTSFVQTFIPIKHLSPTRVQHSLDQCLSIVHVHFIFKEVPLGERKLELQLKSFDHWILPSLAHGIGLVCGGKRKGKGVWRTDFSVLQVQEALALVLPGKGASLAVAN
jgi:hypothetical protein